MLPTQSLSSRLQTPKGLPGAWVPRGRKTPLSFPQGSSQVRYIGELLILIKGTPQLCVSLFFISPMSFLKFRVPSSCYQESETVCLQACTIDFLPTLWHKIFLFTWDLQEGIPRSLWQSLNSLQSPRLAACLRVSGINNSSNKPLTQ